MVSLAITGILLFVAIMFLTMKRQISVKMSKLNPEEFKLWFQNAYMGMGVSPVIAKEESSGSSSGPKSEARWEVLKKEPRIIIHSRCPRC